MKRMILFSAVCLSSMATLAQAPAKKTPVTAKPTNTKPVVKPAALKNATDSFSYALGVSMAAFYQQQGIKDINQQYIVKALNDMKLKKPLMDENVANTTISARVAAAKAEKGAANKKIGDAFLAANKKKPGVITTASGLQYEIIKEGTGPKPTTADQVKVHYVGTLLDGKEFDSSVRRGEPITFGVTGVIRGWTEALQLMSAGSKWKLYIPAELAYGNEQAGPDIKPGSVLVFEVELLEVIKGS